MTGKTNTKQSTMLAIVLFFSVAFGAILYFYGDQWLRSLLLFLSHSRFARDQISNLGIAKRVSRRFVAGESLNEAMASARAINSKGMLATLDYLGERVTEERLAVASRDEILSLLDRIEATGINANVSVKLTQLGIRIREGLALENCRLILTRAKQYNNKIRIDMEESELVDSTLEIYRTLRDDDGFDNVGVVIQSYLYRSEDDVRSLIREGAWIRLCKGAYAEPPDIAFPEKADTDMNYVRLAEMMLSETARFNGVYLGIATHDEQLVHTLISYTENNDIAPEDYEFQMLYGIRRDLQDWLVRKGFKVRIYIPYGTAWYPYFVRRLAERPANLWFFISNLVRN
jgi:proline dehydrogenase